MFAQPLDLLLHTFFFSKIFNLPTHPATPLATKPSPLLLCTENKPHKFSSSISNSVLTAEYFVKISNDNLDITTAKQIILPDRPATLRYIHTQKQKKKITLGADLETGSAHPPHSPLLVMRPLPEIPAVIGVWIAVFGHHHPVGKLPACQPLHGLLGVKN